MTNSAPERTETEGHDSETWIGLSGLVDGELPDADRVLLELDRPDALDALRELVRIRALFTPGPTSEALAASDTAELREEISWSEIRAEAQRGQVRRHRPRRHRLRTWPVAALLAMVLGIGFWLGLLVPDAAAPPPTPNPALLAEWRADHLPPRPDRVLRLGPEDRFVPTQHQETSR